MEIGVEDGEDCDGEEEDGDWEFVDEDVADDGDGSVLNRKPVDMPIRDETGE